MDARQNMDKRLNASGESTEVSELVDKIARYLMQNNISQNFLRAALTEVIESWGKDSRVKNTLTRPVLRTIAQGWPDHGSQSKRLQEIEQTLKQDTTLQELCLKLPAVINQGLEMCEDLSRDLADADPEQKSKILGTLLSEIDTGTLGSISSNLAKTIQDIHQRDPEFLNTALGSHIEVLIQNLDTGQLKESLLDAEQDLLMLVQTVNRILWEHPAKAITLISMAPQLCNTANKVLEQILEPLQDIPPDIFADVVLALGKDINTKELARTANSFLEIIRKLHTGSELLGEQNNPMLRQVLEQHIHEFLQNLDKELLISSVGKLQDIKGSTQEELRRELQNHPELADQYLKNGFRKLSRKSSDTREKLDMLENLEGESGLAQLLGGYLDEVDFGQPAENLSRIVSLIIDAHSEDPELLPELCGQFFSSLDENDLKEIWKILLHTIPKHNPGLVHTLLPSMINSLADLISSANQSPEDDLAKSVLNLKNAIQDLEVES